MLLVGSFLVIRACMVRGGNAVAASKAVRVGRRIIVGGSDGEGGCGW